MKKKILLAVILLASATGLRAATNDLTSLLQQGLFDEEANHDLTSAIADYQSLATQFDRDRQVAATAIYRLGECYRKLGQTNEAVSEYQRILKEFGEQKDLVTLSQHNLTGLGTTTTHFQDSLEKIVGHATSNSKALATSDTAAEAHRQMSVVINLQRAPLPTVLQIAPTILPDPALINLINQYSQTDLDILRKRAEHGVNFPGNPDDSDDIKILTVVRDGIGKKIIERLAGLRQALEIEITDAGLSSNVTDKPLGRIFISGAVRTQGPIEMRMNENLTVGQAILEAGGMSDFANKMKVKVVRATPGTNEDKTVTLDMEQILEQGHTEKDIVLKPCDYIMVPSKLFNF